jgi:hypothetical protein
MYWPIGAPRIYAASKNELDPKHTTTSHDGLEAQGHIQTPNTEPNANGTAIHDQDGDEDDAEEEIHEDEKVNGSEQTMSETSSEGKLPASEALKDNETSSQGIDDDPGGEIVGLKVTRSGHMFATITQATLTVWQTKVAVTTPVIMCYANLCSSPPL